jgi:sterol desaturase/sphingolipid hydroxylase (fatty acid hydroxylase superfamily)
MQLLGRLLLLIPALLAWSGLAYAIHRLAHWPATWNHLHRWHRVHHQPDYFDRQARLRWHHFLLCFGSPAETLDIWCTLTLPALLITWLLPDLGFQLLLFHYAYEIFCSDQRLDHNPAITGPVTRLFAWGRYHLRHHSVPSCNYGLIVTLWDHIFATAHRPATVR